MRPHLRLRWIGSVALSLLLAASLAQAEEGPRKGIPVYKKKFFSKVYDVAKVYKSMQGPESIQRIRLRPGPPELLWVRAYRTEIVGKDSDEALPPDFMCHNNLNLEHLDRHRELFGWEQRGQPRLFTLSQGQMEVVFPKGFAMPLMSDESLLVATQVLNHNLPDADFEVRHKTTIEYVRDRDLKRPMKALYQQGVEGLVLVDGQDGHPNKAEGDDAHGEGCSIGAPAGTGKSMKDAFGRVFNGHWVVPPGRSTYHTPVNDYLNLTHDSSVHYIAVHLHPFAESLALRDLTTGEEVYKSQATNSPFQIGLSRVDHYSNPEGLKVYKDHDYELVVVYNNTSSEPQDSMAVFFMYHWDRDFKKPTAPQAAAH